MAILDLLGVREVGGNRGVSVPKSPNKPLTLYQGTDNTIRFRSVLSSGVPDILTNQSVQLTITKNGGSDSYPRLVLIGEAVPGAGADRMNFYQTLGQIRDFTPGRWTYDVKTVSPGGTDVLVPLSPLLIGIGSGATALSQSTVYFGSAAQPVTIDEAFVQSLSESANQSWRQRIIQYDQGAGEFGWYSYPASFGGVADDFFDTDTDFEAGVQLAATILIGGVSYFVWRTDVAGLGIWAMEAR